MHDDRSPDGAFPQGVDAASDRDLLALFVRHSDARAFSEIVRRHGTLVLGVCRRVLRDRHAAEDAFQATFLVLARSAPRIRRQRSLASWLHSVAYRIAMRSLAESHRRREQNIPMETVTSTDELRDVGELYEQQLLDEELQELPPKYREPLVLHHLQGLSLQQVADRLGMTVPAVDGRLKRGRKELKLRLMRRGVEFGTALAAIHLCQTSVQAASIEPLIALTTNAVAATTSGTTVPSTVSSQAASLAGKELSLMTTSTKLVMTLGISAIVVSLLGLAAGNAAPASGAGRGALPRISTVVDGRQSQPSDGIVLAQVDSAGASPAEDASAIKRDAEIQELDERLQELIVGLERLRSWSRRATEDDPGALYDLHNSIENLGVQLEIVERQIEALQSDGDLENGNGVRRSDRLPYRQPTLVYRPSDAAVERIEEALDARTTAEMPGNPLNDVVDYLSAVHMIPIILDTDALSAAGVSPDAEIEYVVPGATRLRNVLDIMLTNIGGVSLDYIIRNEVLTITTREQADRFLDTRVYNLSHLSSTYSAEEVARIVRSTIRPWTWREQDSALQTGVGVGANAAGQVEIQVDERFQASVEALSDALVVTQSQRIHREVVELLQQLHRHDPESTTSAIITAAINEQLDQLVELAFSDVPWRTAVSATAYDNGLNIVFDERALADAGLTGNEDITIAVTDITLRSALRLVLEQVGLTFVVEDEVIKVTTPEDAADRAANSGPASSATADVADGNDTEPVRGTTSDLHATVAPQLDELTNLDFHRVRFEDVLSRIARQHKVPIAIDLPKVGAAGVERDQEVTFSVDGVTLRDALDLLLSDVGGIELAWFLNDESIWITTPSVLSTLRPYFDVDAGRR